LVDEFLPRAHVWLKEVGHEFRRRELRYNRRHLNIVAVIVTVLFFFGAGLSFYTALSHAQSPTGGSQFPEAPEVPNVLMQYGLLTPQSTSSVTSAYNAKTNNFDNCRWPACGHIVTKKSAAGKRYHFIRLSQGEVVVSAYYNYHVPKRARKYFGKYFGDTNWDGRGTLGDTIILTVKDGEKKYSFKAKLEYIEVQASDPRQDSIPPYPCPSECGGMVGPDTK
jgi:hypothetical protein